MIKVFNSCPLADSNENDTNNQGTQLAQMSFGSNDVNNQATNLNLTEVNNEGTGKKGIISK